MKNPFFLVFTLLNVLVISCANKGADNSADAKLTPSELKIKAVLNKKFDAKLQMPGIAPPSLSKSELASGNVIIKGTIEGTPARSVYLQELTKTQFVPIDSVKVDEKGNFSFSLASFTEPTICFLSIDAPRPPGIPIVLGQNTKLSLAMKNSGWISYLVTGDKMNQQMSELYKIYLGHDMNLQDFNREISMIDPSTVNDSLRNSVSNRFQAMQKARTDDLAKFVNTSEGSPASYYAVTFLFEQPNFSLMQVAYDKMKTSLPASKYTLDLKTSIESIAPLEIGGLAPDIALKGLDGKEIKLSSLRGKVVMIDFWASWCGPCRKENPAVVQLYNKYKSKGFEIYGVSLDDNADKWKGAIQKDGLTWKHVSDLQGWQSSAAKTYQISSIPSTVLLDKNGRIVAKGLRGEALELKVGEMLK